MLCSLRADSIVDVPDLARPLDETNATQVKLTVAGVPQLCVLAPSRTSNKGMIKIAVSIERRDYYVLYF